MSAHRPALDAPPRPASGAMPRPGRGRRPLRAPAAPARAGRNFTPLRAPAVLAVMAGLAACDPGADVALETDVQRASYAIGRNMAESLDEIRDHIDLPAVFRGVSDGLADVEPALTPEEAQNALMAFQQMLADVQAVEDEAARAEGEAFLAENANREGVMTTESGLQYEVLREGDGASPEAGQRVQVHYRGTLTDGTEFDTSYGGDPASFSLDNLIQGFAEAIMLMQVGGQLRAYIPGDLAYGEAGRPGIPPNAVLIFELELLGIE